MRQLIRLLRFMIEGLLMIIEFVVFGRDLRIWLSIYLGMLLFQMKSFFII